MQREPKCINHSYKHADLDYKKKNPSNWIQTEKEPITED